MTKKRKKSTAEKKFTAEKINYFFDQKWQFTYLLASIKEIQATKEAARPQKKTPSTSKHEIS
jgi:hypothetical protein